jgi:hypothetical protein
MPERAKPGDILLYQLSTASPVAEFLLGRPEPWSSTITTSPRPVLRRVGGPHREKVALARLQMAELAPAAILGIADSAFNAAELRQPSGAPPPR